MLALAALAAPLSLSACKHRGEATSAPFTESAAKARAAELEKHLARHPDDDPAALELASLQWLHLRATATAVPTFDRLASKGNPYAQLARLLIADARLDLATVRTQAQALIKGAGKPGLGPADAAERAALAELAARYLANWTEHRAHSEAYVGR